MTVEVALAKVDALMASGSVDPSSPDVALLIEEMKGAGANYREKLKSQKAAGQLPEACPPGKLNMSLEEVIGGLRAYPADARASTTLTVAFAELVRKSYPCNK
jgi:hypothetical protein